MENKTDLSRFTAAFKQSYQIALREIKNGCKYSHWMWYIFPQIHSLGRSPTSQYYAIQSLEEAAAFLNDPYLSGNLIEICNAMLALETNDAAEVLGRTDSMKLKSSMTLFSLVPEAAPVFQKVLDKFFDGKCDSRTLSILGIHTDAPFEEFFSEKKETQKSVLNTIICDDNNIDEIRAQYPDGLHFVVGDTHCEYSTLKALMQKIKFDAEKDHVYFLGDYNGGGIPDALLKYISMHYQADNMRPGFHLIRGNHERELCPVYRLENLPDIIVLKMEYMNYYMAHAGMIRQVFDLINTDMAARPDEKVYAYRLDDKSVGYDAPLRQMIWSRRGLYSQKSHWHNWPSEESLYHNRAVILHGHTPYCFFMKHFSYGDDGLFWKNQHIWFSEALQSFNLDSNIKGRYEFGEGWRGLSCVCLEVIDKIAGSNNCSLSSADLKKSPNGVFTAEYVRSYDSCPDASLDDLLLAKPEMKTIMSVENDDACFLV